MPVHSQLSPCPAPGMLVRPAPDFIQHYISELKLHRAPIPEEEPLDPLPGEEPSPDEEEPPPHPDPSISARTDYSRTLNNSMLTGYRLQARTFH